MPILTLERLHEVLDYHAAYMMAARQFFGEFARAE
jgi:hypothetical protein